MEKRFSLRMPGFTGVGIRENFSVVYRFRFNGMELDKEGMGGGGSTYDYGFRIYNAQLGKFLSVDPLTASYPWYTPYQFAGNKPIWAIDLDGLESAYITMWDVIVLDDGSMLIKQLTKPVLTTSNGDWSGIKNENGYFFNGNYFTDPNKIKDFSISKKEYKTLQSDFNFISSYKQYRKSYEGKKFESTIVNYFTGASLVFVGGISTSIKITSSVNSFLTSRFGKGAFDVLGQAIAKGDIDQIDWADAGASALIDNRILRDLLKSIINVTSEKGFDLNKANAVLAEFGLRLTLNKVSDKSIKNGTASRYILDIIKKIEMQEIKTEINNNVDENK